MTLNLSWVLEDKFLRPKKILALHGLALTSLIILTSGLPIEWVRVLAETIVWVWAIFQVIFAGSIVLVFVTMAETNLSDYPQTIEHASYIVQSPIIAFYSLSVVFTLLLYMNQLYVQGVMFVGVIAITLLFTDLIRKTLTIHLKEKLKKI